MGMIRFDGADPAIGGYDYHLNPHRKYVFSSLQALMAFLEQFDTTGCYFRGQAGLWDIKSSLFRHYGTERFEPARITSAAAVRWLKDNRLIAAAIRDNENYALAVAQHYGCPTDLVDVTTSLRVAGYFASSDNAAHENQPEGCIWVFTAEDIEMYQRLFPLKNPSEHITAALEKNHGSLLIRLDIPELSRLNAQKGAFLWDIGGSLHDRIMRSGFGCCFVFRHTPDEKAAFAEDEKALFPLPNPLESEIMRIFTEKSREGGFPTYAGLIQSVLEDHTGVTTNGLKTELVEQAVDQTLVSKPDVFTPSFGEYPWQKRDLALRQVHPKDIDLQQCKQANLHFDEEGILALVDDVLTSLAEEKLTDYLVLLLDAQKKNIYVIEKTETVVEMIITLYNYDYTRQEIARALMGYLRIHVFLQQAKFRPQSEQEYRLALAFGQVDALMAQHYGCPVTKLDIHDSNGFTSFWLPADYEFLTDACRAEFERFEKPPIELPEMLRGLEDRVGENAQIFLYQHQPRKILPYENLKKMFLELILPQLFVFRQAHERICIPDHIHAITPPFLGRHLYTW